MLTGLIGKTNQHGRIEYGAAVRHRNPLASSSFGGGTRSSYR